jgi:hypothetical protein
MSHVSLIEIEVSDLEALRLAASALCLDFVEGQATYAWYGSYQGDYPLPQGVNVDDLGKCDHAIRPRGVAGSYEVGVCKRGSTYSLLWDFWNGGFGLQDAIGRDGIKLRREYAAQAAIRRARAQGFATSRSSNSQGQTILTFTKP